MDSVKEIFELVLLFCFTLIPVTRAQMLKIMPMGNSITFDDNSLDVSHPRPIGDRISYRYHLYELLFAAGYNFDFTGSEDGGNNYFQDVEMDDNAGFPGINDAQLAYLIETGFNLRTSTRITDGPYLNTYPADIILLEIGTNDLDQSPNDVEDILDNIRSFDNDVIIFVARIINRRTYSSLTTLFNDNVQAMVTARGDERIISVNLETGAGINYSTDMMDELHPNQNGYNKMAVKWFQAIESLNSAPVISDIPPQTANEGSEFTIISLDDYVSDAEDQDAAITWTYRKQPASNLAVSINSVHELQVGPLSNDWNGSEVVTLIAEDAGNGSIRKKDSVDMVFTVLPVNDPPYFISTPITITNEDEPYQYTISVNDPDTGSHLTLSAPVKPDWLILDPLTGLLSGVPANENVGKTNITVRISDGFLSTDQSFELTVNNVNDPPVIISTPVQTTMANQVYFYELQAADEDGDTLAYMATSIPDWMDFVAGSQNGILSSTPSENDIGTFLIKLEVSDGDSAAYQEFNLTVTDMSDINNMGNTMIREVFPNPAHDRVDFELSVHGKVLIKLFNLTGELVKTIESESPDTVEVIVSDLPAGMYIYRAYQNNKMSYGKLIKN